MVGKPVIKALQLVQKLPGIGAACRYKRVIQRLTFHIIRLVPITHQNPQRQSSPEILVFIFRLCRLNISAKPVDILMLKGGPYLCQPIQLWDTVRIQECDHISLCRQDAHIPAPCRMALGIAQHLCPEPPGNLPGAVRGIAVRHKDFIRLLGPRCQGSQALWEPSLFIISRYYNWNLHISHPSYWNSRFRG